MMAVEEKAIRTYRSGAPTGVLKPDETIKEMNKTMSEAELAAAEKAPDGAEQKVDGAGDKPFETLSGDLQQVLGLGDDEEDLTGPPPKSLEFQLSDGRTCEIAEPMIPIDLLITRFIPDSGTQQGTTAQIIASMNMRNYEALLYVKKLNGKDKPLPGSAGKLMELAGELGNQGFKEVRSMKERYYPDVTTAKLTVIKKNSH